MLAFATASRHPGVAIAIVQMNFPSEPAVTPAVLLYLVTSTVIMIPFQGWLKQSAAKISPRRGA